MTATGGLPMRPASAMTTPRTVTVAPTPCARATAIVEPGVGLGVADGVGDADPQLAIILGNLGAIYVAQGRYADAEPVYEQVVTIRQIALGPDHPDLAVSLTDLAGIYALRVKLAQAEPRPAEKRPFAARCPTVDMGAGNTVGPARRYGGQIGRHLQQAEAFVEIDLQFHVHA